MLSVYKNMCIFKLFKFNFTGCRNIKRSRFSKTAWKYSQDKCAGVQSSTASLRHTGMSRINAHNNVIFTIYMTYIFRLRI